MATRSMSAGDGVATDSAAQTAHQGPSSGPIPVEFIDSSGRSLPALKHRVGNLSCVTVIRTRRRRLLARDCFDVPRSGDHHIDAIAGLTALRELMEALRSDQSHSTLAREVIRDAAAKMLRNSTHYHAGSWSFMNALHALLEGAARYLDWEGLIESRIEEERRCEAWLRREEANDKFRFVERMRAARAAKRTAREASHD